MLESSNNSLKRDSERQTKSKRGSDGKRPSRFSSSLHLALDHYLPLYIVTSLHLSLPSALSPTSLSLLFLSCKVHTLTYKNTYIHTFKHTHTQTDSFLLSYIHRNIHANMGKVVTTLKSSKTWSKPAPAAPQACKKI